MKSPTSEDEQYHVLPAMRLLGEKIGGLGLQLDSGSILFECARWEFHATTPLKEPSNSSPSRLGLVFFQHQKLSVADHGHGHHVLEQLVVNIMSIGNYHVYCERKYTEL